MFSETRTKELALTGTQRMIYWLYALAWHLALPFALVYFWRRGKKEPLYRQHLPERFGRVRCYLERPVWLHCASLGELRGMMPLIDHFLEQGLPIFLSTLTPAGRQAATEKYAQAMTQQRLQVAYLPLELSWAVAQFASRVNARCMISSEIDTWPVLLMTLKRTGLPLGFVNAGYPLRSFEKDKRWAGVRAAFFRAYDLVLCKSALHAQRFEQIGCPRVVVAGELRFELPMPQWQQDRARILRSQLKLLNSHRQVLCVASAVAEEHRDFLGVFKATSKRLVSSGLPKPLLVYVPRSPQQFDDVAALLAHTELRAVRRSQLLDAQLQFLQEADVHSLVQADVLLGDSLGEMAFYLALSDNVTVGSSFSDKGSHNIIESLSLHKPTCVGPSIWTIEYPATEALEAGALTQVQDWQDLEQYWLDVCVLSDVARAEQQQRSQQFMQTHGGSVLKHWKALNDWRVLA